MAHLTDVTAWEKSPALAGIVLETRRTLMPRFPL